MASSRSWRPAPPCRNRTPRTRKRAPPPRAWRARSGAGAAGGPSPPALTLVPWGARGGGQPGDQPASQGGGCCSVAGMRRWAERCWGVWCSPGVTRGLFPPPRWPLRPLSKLVLLPAFPCFSSPSREATGTELALNSVMLTPRRARRRRGATSPKPFGGGPCPKECGPPRSLVPAAPGSALLLPGRIPLGPV